MTTSAFITKPFEHPIIQIFSQPGASGCRRQRSPPDTCSTEPSPQQGLEKAIANVDAACTSAELWTGVLHGSGCPWVESELPRGAKHALSFQTKGRPGADDAVARPQLQLRLLLSSWVRLSFAAKNLAGGQTGESCCLSCSREAETPWGAFPGLIVRADVGQEYP